MKIKVGVVYRSAGQRVDVEAGHKRLGRTSHDVSTGQQTFWFPDVETFERVKYDLFECASPLAKPVPIFRLVDETAPPPPPFVDEHAPVVVVEDEPEPEFVPTPTPAPVPTGSLADDIFTALAGRKIRVKDFAAELGLTPEMVHDTVSADPRFATITAGWVRAAESPAE